MNKRMQLICTVALFMTIGSGFAIDNSYVDEQLDDGIDNEYNDDASVNDPQDPAFAAVLANQRHVVQEMEQRLDQGPSEKSALNADFGLMTYADDIESGLSSSSQTAEDRHVVAQSGRKFFNISDLPYIPMKPHLTVLSRNIDEDDKISLYVSVAYKHQVSFSWRLNGAPFEDHDNVRNQEMGSVGLDRQYRSKLHQLEIEHLLRLPTMTGRYEFQCTVTADYVPITLTHVFENMLLTDDCPPANCFDRNAVCTKGRCICDKTSSMPVQLVSKHVTCRQSVSLQGPCHYTEECKMGVPNSECVAQGWCACLKGFARSPRNKCTEVKGRLVNMRCDSDKECAPLNATCILSHCTCPADFQSKGGRCVAAVKLHQQYSSSTRVCLCDVTLMLLFVVLTYVQQ